jgi:hypothetical protein
MISRRKTEIVQVNLRLREEFRQRLVGCAQRHGLSLNQEMVRRLEQSFEHEERQDLKADLKATIREEMGPMMKRLAGIEPLWRDVFSQIGFSPPPWQDVFSQKIGSAPPPQDRVTNKPKDEK